MHHTRSGSALAAVAVIWLSLAAVPAFAQAASAAPVEQASSPMSGAPATSSSETLAADSLLTTSSGATFTAPAGWAITSKASVIVLEPPEADSHIAIVDVQAASADEAHAKAWALYKPGAAPRPLKIASPQAPRNGWEERRTFTYETSPNERMVAFAAAWRAGSTWAVIIAEANESTYEKRSSPISLMLQSLRPKGYQRETFAGKKTHPLDAARIATMKAFVEDGMKQLGVPGVGFSLIDGGRVVYEGGVGVKELGKPAPVDANTLFIAASNTKAMTTLLLAQLVDEKKIRWDEPVTEVDPAFKLGDADTTRRVLVKHLVCACTGMPRQDMEWLFEFKGKTPASSMALLGGMQPTSRFGEVFQYSNLMVSTAGYIGAAVIKPGAEVGAAYDDAMRRRIFAPLGMNDTTFDFATALRGDHASPHGDDVDGNTRVGRMDLNYAVVPARPAGGVWTSAHDLSRFVMMELAGGKGPNGKRIVSTENLLARREPQVMVSADVSYGMGLIVSNRWGTPVVSHGGDLAGYHSDMLWLPEHNVGAVILTNGDSGVLLRGPFMRKLVELLFDGRPEADAQLRAGALQRKQNAAKERERLVIPADPAEAAKLAIHYTDASLGGLTVRREGGKLMFDVGEWHSDVASRKNDDGTISFITVDPTLAGFEFVVAEREGMRALLMRDAQHEYVFKEVGVKSVPRKRRSV